MLVPSLQPVPAVASDLQYILAIFASAKILDDARASKRQHDTRTWVDKTQFLIKISSREVAYYDLMCIKRELVHTDAALALPCSERPLL